VEQSRVVRLRLRRVVGAPDERWGETVGAVPGGCPG
jgi:hypothetical protein